MVVVTIASLPNEVLSECLSLCNVEELLYCTRVSVRWRTIAHACPLYWRSIRLSALSASALEFFLARLSSSKSTGLTIGIILARVPNSNGHAQGIVRAALAQHLPRTAKLIMSCSHPFARAVLDGLMGPVPLLKVFRLRITPKPGHAVTLPDNLFGHQTTPQLDALELHNVQLFSDHSLPQWASRAQSVEMNYESGCIASVPVDIFNCFSETRKIKVLMPPSVTLTARLLRRAIRAKPFDTVINSFCGPRPGSEYGEPLDLLLQAAATTRIGVIVAPLETIHNFLQHFTPNEPLQLVIKNHAILSTRMELDVRTTRVRPELSRYFTIPNSPPIEVFHEIKESLQPIRGQIVRLQITLRVTPSIGMLELLHCTSLVIVLDDQDMNAAATQCTRLVLPALETIDVVGDLSPKLVLKDIVRFFEALLWDPEERGEHFIESGATEDGGRQFMIRKL